MKELTFKKKISRIGLAYFLCMLFTQVFSIVFAMLLSAFAPSFLKNEIFPWVIGQLPLYSIGFPCVYFILKTIPDGANRPQKQKISLVKWLKYLCVVMAAMVIGNLISQLLIMSIALLKQSPIVNPLNSLVTGTGLNLLYTFIFGAVLVPIGEEFLFRFLPYKKISQYGDKFYILLTSFIFAMFHANFFQLIYAFLIGAVLSYVYSKTGNIIYSILLHMAINTYGMIISPAASKNNIILIVVTVLVYIITGLGIYFYIQTRKNLNYKMPTVALPEHMVKDVLLNLGFILYNILIIVLIIFVTLQ